MYLALHWVVVEDPREIEVPGPPLSPQDIMSGVPLQVWAADVTEQYLARP
jgi:Ni,Fe-hydrogenase III small subunit